MKKRVMFVFCFVLVLSLAFVSASFFGNIFEKFTGKAVYVEGNLREVYPEDFSYFSQDEMIMQENLYGEESPKYKGYLIEFEGVPIAVKSLELEKQVVEKAGVVEEKKGFFFRLFGMAIFSPRSLPQESNLDQYRNELINENNLIKQRIENKFSEQGKTLKIETEFNVLFNGIYVDVSDLEVKLIENVEGVKRVSPNYEVKTTLMDSVPLINADDVWDLDKNLNRCGSAFPDNKGGGQTNGEDCLTGKGVSIAILDTGIDYTHPDLGGCFGEGCKVVDGYDFVNEDNDPMDDQGHGTHCAGIAAGKGVLNGVAPDAKLYAYKVLDSEGYGNWDNVIAGLERAIDPNQDGNFKDHLDIISMSLGAAGGNVDDFISLAVDQAVGMGSVVVIAAGNSGLDEQTIWTPGISRKAITVGASDNQDQIASFSSRGPVIWENNEGELNSLIKPDVVAPGVDICSSQWENAWQEYECVDTEHTAISGTSMATPHVAGAVALLKQKNPDWTPEEIKMVFRNTAVDVGEEVIAQGQGRIDVLEAIEVEGKPMIAELLELDYLPNGTLNIYGTAKGEEFSSYGVYFAEEGSNDWNLICQGDDLVEANLLCSLDVEGMVDGIYNVKLVVHSYDWFSEDYGVFEIDNVKILNFEDYDLYRLGDLININFEILNPSINFTSIEIFDENGSLGSTGTIIVNNSFMIWNTSQFEEKFYNITLIFGLFGTFFEENVLNIYLDPTIKEGWPKKIGFENSIIHVHPIIVADLNNDNNKEIIFQEFNVVTGEFFTHALNVEGQDIEGWPINDLSPGNLNGPLKSSLSISDLENNGDKELIFTYHNKINCISANTTFLWDFVLFDYFEDDQHFSPSSVPIIADLNNDGKKEIVLISWGACINGGCYPGRIFVLDSEGNLLEGWPKIITGKSDQGSPIVGDVNNDGYGEIFVAERSGALHLYNYGGDELNGWPIYSGEEVLSQPILADLNNDNYLEILIGGNYLYVFNYLGVNIQGWPIELLYNFNNINVGDIDNKGDLEVVVTEGGNHLSFYDHLGNNISDLFLITTMFDLIMGNVFGSDDKEILWYENCPEGMIGKKCKTPAKLYVADNAGSILNSWPKFVTGYKNFFYNGWTYNHYVSPVIIDFDNDAKTEIILATNKYIYIWETNSTHNPAKMDWPMFQHDSAHTGNYEACSDGTLPGQCSYPKPSYCQDRVFVNNCQECGCPEGVECLSNGNCVESVGVVNGSAVVD